MIIAELVWCNSCQQWRRCGVRAYRRGRCLLCQGAALPLACGDRESLPCQCEYPTDNDFWLSNLADHDAIVLYTAGRAA